MRGTRSKNPTAITHASIKTIAAFLNTEGGDLVIGVNDARTPVGLEPDGFESDDKFMLHLSQVFNWYADDFGGQAKLADYVDRYHAQSTRGFKVSFIDYSWDLNITDN